VIPDSEIRPDRRARAKSRRMLAMLCAIGVTMFGFAYANVPYFYMMCKKYGVLPKDLSAPAPAANTPDAKRPLSVYFLANPGGTPIAFSVKQRVQDIHIGERAINEYTFVNLAKGTYYFRPVHDVSPREAGGDNLTLEKCFCFDEQKILEGQTYTLPVVYRFGEGVDAKTSELTMSYTLFPSTKEQYEASQEATKKAAAEAMKEPAKP